MSDTAVTPDNQTATTNATTTTNAPAPAPNSDGMILDGEAPRLGSAPLIPPVPMGGAGTQVASDGSGAATLPVVSPVLTAPTQTPGDRFADQAKPFADADLPTLPTAAPTRPLSTEDDTDEAQTDDAEPRHPMAHLMPAKSKPTQASIRAAEQRAIKKAKARKIKLGVAVGALIVAILAGPPLLSWLSGAVNDAGALNDDPAD